MLLLPDEQGGRNEQFDDKIASFEAVNLVCETKWKTLMRAETRSTSSSLAKFVKTGYSYYHNVNFTQILWQNDNLQISPKQLDFDSALKFVSGHLL